MNTNSNLWLWFPRHSFPPFRAFVAFEMHQGFREWKRLKGLLLKFSDQFSVTLELRKLPCHSVHDFDRTIMFSRRRKDDFQKEKKKNVKLFRMEDMPFGRAGSENKKGGNVPLRFRMLKDIAEAFFSYKSPPLMAIMVHLYTPDTQGCFHLWRTWYTHCNVSGVSN